MSAPHQARLGVDNELGCRSPRRDYDSMKAVGRNSSSTVRNIDTPSGWARERDIFRQYMKRDDRKIKRLWTELLVVVIILRLIKPLRGITISTEMSTKPTPSAYLQKRFTRFANFLACLLVHVLPADVGSPLFDDFLI